MLGKDDASLRFSDYVYAEVAGKQPSTTAKAFIPNNLVINTPTIRFSAGIAILNHSGGVTQQKFQPNQPRNLACKPAATVNIKRVNRIIHLLYQIALW